MDVVTVPLVSPASTVEQALAAMNGARRAGVVVEEAPDRYRLLFAGDLLRARASNVPVVGAIGGGEAVVLVDPLLAQSFQIDLVRPSRSPLAYEQMLDARGSSFGLVGEGPADVMLVTRHEGLGEMLTLTGGYECTGSPRHYFPQPYVTAGQQCPLYPACAVDGAPPSTIRPV
jgi:CBS domain-containing protein